jgi:regulator of sigma E protease
LLSSTLSIIQAIVGFSFLVFIHELGHFLAAKWVGVRVDVFSIGFGPALKRKWGKTEYRLSLIPLGGFVKLAGEDREEDDDSEPAPDEFRGKTVGQRSFVFIAGVVMNVIFGFIFFILAYRVGVPILPAEVGGVYSGSAAWKAGLREGDHFKKIGGWTDYLEFTDFKTGIVLAGEGEGIPLIVERDGVDQEVVLYPTYNEMSGMMFAGVMPVRPMRLAPRDKAKKIEKAVALYDAGLKGGDEIVRVQVEGREPVVTDSRDLLEDEIWTSQGKPITIFAMRNGVEVPAVVVKPTLPKKDSWVIGLAFGSAAEIEQLREGSWARDAKLKIGDLILKVDGQAVRSGLEAWRALDKVAAKAVDVEVRRDDKVLTLNVAAHDPKDDAEWVIAFRKLGLHVGAVSPGLPAAVAGIMPGDVITKANGTVCNDFQTFRNIKAKAKGGAVTVAVMRDGVPMEFKLIPVRGYELAVVLDDGRHTIKLGTIAAIQIGARRSYQWIVRVYATIKSLIFGTISPKQLSGPVMIFTITKHAAMDSFGILFFILAVISVNLGVMNLLPIPVLDGGHLLFALCEKIRGKPLSMRIQGMASYVGLAMLLSLFVVALWNDIWRLIEGF